MKNFVFLAFVVVAVSGCSTVQGVGKDLTKASEAVEQAL